MPNVQIFTSPKRENRRYRVIATGETGTAVSGDHGGRNVGRLVTIGADLNVRVVDICHDETGEIRTYRENFVEEITPAQ